MPSAIFGFPTQPAVGQALVWNGRSFEPATVTAAATVADGDKGDVFVSAGGATWTVESIAGALSLLGSISPAALAASTNDWTPTGIAGAGIVRASASAAVDLTGLASATDGRVLVLHNVGAFTITVKDESVSSAAGNRFALSADLALATDQSALIQYDVTTARWRVIASSVGSGGGGGVSDGDKGDITVSGGGTVWTIDPAVVTLAKMANLATATIIGRNTAGTGVPEALSTLPTGCLPAHTGDATSPLGSAVLTVVGASTSFALTGDTTPAALAANTNDWAPASLASSSVIRAEASANIDLTGLTGGADGRIVVVHNIGGFTITLKDESASSAAANRFALTGDVAVKLDQALALQYDSTSLRWRMVGFSGRASDLAGGTLPSAVLPALSGDVSTVAGATTTTAEPAIITGKVAVTAPASDDVLLMYDTSATALRKIVRSDFGGDLVGALVSSEVSVAAATTLTTTAFGRMHLCSGTTADYTVTLPAASGNAGKIIGFRMASGLTKLVTIDGNASETIDGSLSRVQWAHEVAILLCDGTGWIKIAGHSIPMVCEMRATAAVNISTVTETTLTLATAFYDPASMGDTTNGRVNIRRNATYVVRGYCGLTDTTNGGVDAAGSAFVAVYNAAASALRYGSTAMNTGDFPHIFLCDPMALTTTDNYIYLRIYHNLGTTHSTRASPFASLRLEEVSLW